MAVVVAVAVAVIEVHVARTPGVVGTGRGCPIVVRLGVGEIFGIYRGICPSVVNNGTEFLQSRHPPIGMTPEPLRIEGIDEVFGICAVSWCAGIPAVSFGD